MTAITDTDRIDSASEYDLIRDKLVEVGTPEGRRELRKRRAEMFRLEIFPHPALGAKKP